MPHITSAQRTMLADFAAHVRTRLKSLKGAINIHRTTSRFVGRIIWRMGAPLRHLDSLPSAEEEFTSAFCRKTGLSFQQCKAAPGKQSPHWPEGPDQSDTVSLNSLLQEIPNMPEGVQLENSVTNSSDSEQLTAERCFTEDPQGAETRRVLFENILFLEVFAGTFSLTIEVRKTSLRGVAVDKGTERAKWPITILDITKPEDLKFLMDFIRQEALNLCLVHFASPCGTCSAARKRKLPSEVQAKLKDAGITPPQQLRSEQFPMGFPGIAGLDLYKVEQANKLYFATRDLALLAISLGIRVSMENPTNSLFLKTDPIQELLQAHPGHCNIFHNCMMGGERQKQTTWWCNDQFFSAFNLPCSGDRLHKPWAPTLTADGVHYPTKDEAEYPNLLCQRVAALLIADLQARGIEQPQTITQQIAQRRTTAINSVAMGLLPRGQKLKPLVSEFGHYVQFAVKPDMDASRILLRLTKGARITDRKLLTGGDKRVSDLTGESLKYLEGLNGSKETKVELVTFGIPREPWAFVRKAAQAGHPRFLPYAGSEQLDDLLWTNLNHHACGLDDRRLAFPKKWVNRAK